MEIDTTNDTVTDGEKRTRGKEGGEYIDGVPADELESADPDTLSLTPDQHETLKSRLHGDRLDEIAYSERAYLVIGKGGDSGAGTRRRTACELLERRKNATSFRLENFGLTTDDFDLWAPAFEILCAQATHIVGVLENFDGGHVWELGYLYRQQTTARDVLWLLKRVYDDPETTRERYDNGMAAAHLKHLEKAVGERILEWTDAEDLPDAVAEIP